MRNRLWIGSILVLTSLVGCGLDLNLPEGHIRCERDADCPAGWFCRVEQPQELMLCYRSPSELDAGSAQPVEDAAVREDSATLIDASEGDADAGELVADASVTEDASALDASVPDASKPDPSGAPPTLTALTVQGNRRYLSSGVTTPTTCLASDPDDDPLTYAWSANLGTFSDSTLRSPLYTAAGVGAVTLQCVVADNHFNEVSKSLSLRVYPSGWLAMLPFSGDSNDVSGNGSDGLVSNGVQSVDRAGTQNASIEFSGDGQVSIQALAVDLRSWSFVATLRPGANGGTIVSKAESAMGQLALYINPSNSTTLPGRIQYLQADQNGGPYALVLGDYRVQPNSFFQLAVTRTEAGQLRAYVDGQLIHAHDRVPAARNEKAPVVLGGGYLGNYWGIIDEVSIYERALSAAEVAALTMLQ